MQGGGGALRQEEGRRDLRREGLLPSQDRPRLAAQTSLPPVRLKKDVEKKKASRGKNLPPN